MDDNQFVSGGVDCVVKLWDIRKGQCVKDLTKPQRPIRAMKVMGNNLIYGLYCNWVFIPSGGEDRAISVLDLNDHTVKKKIDIKNYLLCIATCDFGMVRNKHTAANLADLQFESFGVLCSVEWHRFARHS